MMNLRTLSDISLGQLVAAVKAEGISDEEAVQIATNIITAIKTAFARITRFKAAQIEAERAAKLSKSLIALGATKQCRVCGRTLALTDFPSNGHGCRCRKCNSARERRKKRERRDHPSLFATALTIRVAGETKGDGANDHT